MRDYSSATLAALEAGQTTSHGAVRIGTTPTPRLYWGGYGSLSLNAGVAGAEPYVGIGAAGLVSVSGGTLGDAEQGAEIVLSAVDPSVLAMVDLATVRGAPVVIWRLIFDVTGETLLSANVHLRGRADRAPQEDVIGGQAAVRLMVEGSVRGMGLRRERMRTDADQRLIAPADNGFKKIATAPFVQLMLGGRPPARAGEAIPGATPGFGNGGPVSTAIANARAGR